MATDALGNTVVAGTQYFCAGVVRDITGDQLVLVPNNGRTGPAVRIAAADAVRVSEIGTLIVGFVAHVVAADPHPGYQLESQRDAANGYPSLDANGKVPTAETPTAGPLWGPLFDDFETTQLWLTITSGAGANVGTGTDHISSGENANGEMVVTPGTTTTGIAGIYRGGSSGQLLLGSTAVYIEWRGTVGGASSAASEYVHAFGLGDNVTSTSEPANGAYWVYRRATDGDFWVCVTRSGGVETKTVTAKVPADYSTLHLFRIEINAAASSVAFYYDGTLLATHTTNIPTTNRVCEFWKVYQAGTYTTQRWFYADYCDRVFSRSAAR